MNYYFIANNPNNKTFMKKNIFTNKDIVVVFNHNMYKNYKSFKNATEKIHFYRSGGPNGYWGKDIIQKCECTKYLINHNKNDSDFNKKNIIVEDTKMLQEHNYKKEKKYPQSGSIAFHYLENNTDICNPKNKIYLVGFRSVYRRGLWSGHSKKLEDAYWDYIIKKYNNVYRI
jgi:hypothetical protein